MLLAPLLKSNAPGNLGKDVLDALPRRSVLKLPPRPTASASKAPGPSLSKAAAGTLRSAPPGAQKDAAAAVDPLVVDLTVDSSDGADDTLFTVSPTNLPISAPNLGRQKRVWPFSVAVVTTFIYLFIASFAAAGAGCDWRKRERKKQDGIGQPTPVLDEGRCSRDSCRA